MFRCTVTSSLYTVAYEVLTGAGVLCPDISVISQIMGALAASGATYLL